MLRWSTHRILDAIADIQQQQTLQIDDIESVHCGGIANWRNLPTTSRRMKCARFSMQYCVAMMLRNGTLSVQDFTAASVKQQADAQLLAMITLAPWTAEQEAEDRNLPHILTLRFRNGQEIVHARLRARGALDEPFSTDDRQAKFLDCCAALPQAELLYQRLKELAQQADLTFIRQLMV
ncbi:MmgE/PrpD family protein (plasmid) [Pseudomonas silvicola]|nr:MmgE/PrpD family protein [Pseudomonas silvicola]